MTTATEDPKPATKAPPARPAKVGATVCFWPPHPTQQLVPAETPYHAVIASIGTDGRVNLALLSPTGGWQQRAGVRYSDVPKMGCWTWPTK